MLNFYYDVYYLLTYWQKQQHFSLITQEQNIDIICIIDSVENTKHNYECLLKKLQKNSAYVFQLPTVKLVTEEIESKDEDGEPVLPKPESTVLLWRKMLYRRLYCTDC